MAVNQNHTVDRRGALIPHGESFLKKCLGVDLSFPQPPPGSSFFNGTKRGTLFLTSFRVVFVTSHSDTDPMLSFMMPFHLMKNCTVEQPVFGANYIQGTVQAAPDGGWEGSATFKLVFRKGGAIEFAQLMAKAAFAAAQGFPLSVSSFWMYPLGIFVIAGERSMCAPQTCQVPYGIPPAGHGAPPPRYDAMPPGYGGRRYGSPPPLYDAIPVSYEVLPPGYEAPVMQYGVPPPRYETTAVRSSSPPPGYEALPVGYETSPSGHRSIPPRPRAPPTAHEALPAGSEVGHPIPVTAQSPRFQESFPSTSSSPAHSPPS